MAKLILSVLCLASCVLVVQAQANIKNIYSGTGEQTAGTAGTCDATKDYFPWKIPRGAQGHTALFTVEYKNYYKIVKTIGATAKTYLLVQRGCTAPTDVMADLTVEVPLRKVGVASSTWLRFFEAMGERMAIKGLNGAYSTSTCMNKLFKEGKVTDMSMYSYDDKNKVYKDSTSNLTALTSEIDAHFVDGWSKGKNAIFVGTANEPNYQAASEWAHYMSVFFNREEEMNLFSTKSRNRWVCSSNAARGPTVMPKVVWLDYYGTSYGATSPKGFVINTCKAGGASYRHCELIKAAGGQAMTAFTATASPDLYDKKNGQMLGVSEADVKAFAKDADMIVIANNYCGTFSKTGTVETCAKYWNDVVDVFKGTNAHTNDQIYDIGRMPDPSGGTGYFEASVQPEVLLQDMIKATENKRSADTKAGHQFVFLRRMISEGVGNQVKCVAPTATAVGCIPTVDDLAAKCKDPVTDGMDSMGATDCAVSSSSSSFRATPVLAAVSAIFACLFAL